MLYLHLNKERLKMKLKYNLQFFGENDNDTDDNDVDGSVGNDDNGTDNNQDEVDASAFAELISEKDKKIEELEGEVRALKKTNAELTVRISAGQKTERTFEENLLGLVGQPARKE